MKMRQKRTKHFFSIQAHEKNGIKTSTWMDWTTGSDGSNNVNILFHRYSCRQTRWKESCEILIFLCYYFATLVISSLFLNLFFLFCFFKLFFPTAISLCILFRSFYCRCSYCGILFCAFPLVILVFVLSSANWAQRIIAIPLSWDLLWKIVFLHARFFTLTLFARLKKQRAEISLYKHKTTEI